MARGPVQALVLWLVAWVGADSTVGLSLAIARGSGVQGHGLVFGLVEGYGEPAGGIGQNLADGDRGVRGPPSQPQRSTSVTVVTYLSYSSNVP